MAWWQWLLDAAGVLLLLVLGYGLALVVRRRIIARHGGTFELSHRARPSGDGRGWVLGLGRYSGEKLEWFRVFSLSSKAKATWARDSLSYDGRRRAARGRADVALPRPLGDLLPDTVGRGRARDERRVAHRFPGLAGGASTRHRLEPLSPPSRLTDHPYGYFRLDELWQMGQLRCCAHYCRGVQIAEKFNVVVSGPDDAQPLLLAHGFGCDQNMWRFVAPAFEQDFRVVRFDFPGAGQAAAEAYDTERHSSLDGYAQDVLDIIEGLDLRDVVFVGHSVAAMIGAIAERRASERFDKLVMVGPSPCYIDDADYRGGFSEPDIHELLDSLASNYLGWSASMAPVIMGNADRPELGAELSDSFCRMAPEIARTFARVTFLSDARDILPEVTTPTLVLQCSNDVIAPAEVGAYVADVMPDARLTLLEATGHCPHLSAPEETIAAMADFIRQAAPQAV